jgi:hypothetical protein
MREELSMKLKAKALEALQTIAGDPNDRRYLEANKFLLKEALELPKKPVGRPSTKETDKRPQDVIKEDQQVKADLKRLGLLSVDERGTKDPRIKFS